MPQPERQSEDVYFKSKNAILRIIIIISGIIAFALMILGGHDGALAWAFVAYLVSWLFSLLLFLFFVVNLVKAMELGVFYKKFDFCVSLLLLSFCASGSIVLVTNIEGVKELSVAALFGFLTAILYFTEVYLHRKNAPEPTKYAATTRGIVEIMVIIQGHVAHVLLFAGGYDCGRDFSCTLGRTYTLVAYVIAWSITVIIFLIHMTGCCKNTERKVEKFDFIWAILATLLCFTASIVLACFINVGNGKLVAACVVGFFTTVTYALEVFLLNMLPSSSPTPITRPNI